MVSGPNYSELVGRGWRWRQERRLSAVSCTHPWVRYEVVHEVQVTRSKEIISYRRGTTRDISRQTISAYIKEVVVLAYSNASLQDTTSPVHIKPHSVRHVATSLNALRNFSLDDALKAGAWASPNVFIQHYVQSFSKDTMSKLSHLGGFVAAGTVIWSLRFHTQKKAKKQLRVHAERQSRLASHGDSYMCAWSHAKIVETAVSWTCSVVGSVTPELCIYLESRAVRSDSWTVSRLLHLFSCSGR